MSLSCSCSCSLAGFKFVCSCWHKLPPRPSAELAPDGQAKLAEHHQAEQDLAAAQETLKQEAAALAAEKAEWQAQLRHQQSAASQAPAQWLVPDFTALHLSPRDTFRV